MIYAICYHTLDISMIEMKYYLYKIINTLNNMYYYGVHSTYNIDDGYMGSGANITRAIKTTGKHNFKKEILEYFDNAQQMYERESEIVTKELINDPLCYNIQLGGHGGPSGIMTAKDIHNNTLSVKVDDSRLQTGEITHVAKGNVVVRDVDGKCRVISKTSDEYKSGNYEGTTKGRVPVRDKYGNVFCVSVNDERIKTGEFQHTTKGMVNVIIEDGSIKKVPITHPKYISGEYQTAMKGTMKVFDTQQNKVIKAKMQDIYLNPERYIPFSKNRVTVKTIDGKYTSITKDEFDLYKNTKYFAVSKGAAVYVNKQGYKTRLSPYDPRVISGEFKLYTKCIIKAKNAETGKIETVLKWSPDLQQNKYHTKVLYRFADFWKPQPMLYKDEYDQLMKPTIIIKQQGYQEFESI